MKKGEGLKSWMPSSIIVALALFTVMGCEPAQEAKKAKINIYEKTCQIKDWYQSRSDWEAVMFSSYDRSGGNDDGFNGTYSKIRMERGNSVLAESAGAGYISRIWFPHSTHDKDGLMDHNGEHIKIYIDDPNKPAIDMPVEDIFSGDVPGFPKGLVGEGLGGWYCNVPIPFSRYCRVEIEGGFVRFYQVNLQKYVGDRSIESYARANAPTVNPILDKFGRELLKMQEGITEETLMEKALEVKKGQPASFEIIKENGVITDFRLATDPKSLKALLNGNIKIYWDDRQEPAINVPLNMFFAIPDEENPYRSAISGYDDGSLYIKVPMPFSEKAKVEIHSEGTFDLVAQYKIETQSLKATCYLTTFYNEELPTNNKEKPYLCLETTGEGHYIGTFMMTEGVPSENPPHPVWLEGDEIFVCDGEMRIHGTGTEDYFNCGWYGIEGRLVEPGAFPAHGFPQYRTGDITYASAYRWHIQDPVPFAKSLNVTIEHGIDNRETVDYRSIAFYYLKKLK